jgi:hypothetical protein
VLENVVATTGVNVVQSTLATLPSVEYPLPEQADDAMKIARGFGPWGDGPRKRGWRLSEARDFIFLMREVLKQSDAPYLIFNQDDAEWTYRPELLGLPIQSLYHFRPGGPIAVDDNQRGKVDCDPELSPACSCTLGCGMVSMVFRRDVLKHFLRSIAPGVWKLKAIDMLLGDFLRSHGYEWPATRSVQHKGSNSSYVLNNTYMESLKVGGKWTSAFGRETRAMPPKSPRPSRDERHRIYSCDRPPLNRVPEMARQHCASIDAHSLLSCFRLTIRLCRLSVLRSMRAERVPQRREQRLQPC